MFHPSGTSDAGIFVVVPLHFFGSTSTISRFGGRFRDGQYSLVSFLFAVLLLTVPPMESAPRSGTRCPLTSDFANLSPTFNDT